jgi:predicted acetyltransferase
MHDDTIELRQPTADPKVLRAFLEPVAIAFGDDYTDEMFEIDRQLFELDRLVGAVDGERWVGGACAESRRLTVPGGAEVRAAAISGVGVLPSHRRRGILTRLMGWLLDQAADRGEALSVLHASEGAIYPHFGYGMATIQGSIDAERSAFRFSRPAEPLGHVRLVDVDEGMRLIPEIFEQARAGRAGEVSRTPAEWRHQLLGDNSWRRSTLGLKSNAVLEVNGEPRGYASYRVKSEWDDRGPKNILNVLEVVALDPAAERALWEWMVGIDLVGRVKVWRTPVHNPLFLQLSDPRRLGLTIRDGIWVRLVDVRAALEARTYAGPGRVTLEVTDAFRPSTAGRWTMDVPGDRGVASVTAAAPGVEPDLALDIADLGTIYLGAFTFTDLARAGRLRECRDEAIAVADRLFDTRQPPWCSTMF